MYRAILIEMFVHFIHPELPVRQQSNVWISVLAVVPVPEKSKFVISFTHIYQFPGQ